MRVQGYATSESQINAGFFAMSAPDALVRALAQARAERHLGEIAPHFFSFGGVARTARWAEAVAQGRIALEGGEGFRVEPPRER